MQGIWDCKLKDKRDGSYSVTYTATVAGTYRLDVGLAPAFGPIAQSPFSIVVRPAPTDPRTTTLLAPPPDCVQCGRSFTLQLIARDRWGNVSDEPVLSEGDQPSAWIAAEATSMRSPAQVYMLEPGRYNVTVMPVAQGKNTLHVCWAGINVQGSPFSLKALAAPPHASSYKLSFSPQSWPVLRAGSQFKLRVQAYDRFGNMHTHGCPAPRLWLQRMKTTNADSVRGLEACSKSSLPMSPHVHETTSEASTGKRHDGNGSVPCLSASWVDSHEILSLPSKPTARGLSRDPAEVSASSYLAGHETAAASMLNQASRSGLAASMTNSMHGEGAAISCVPERAAKPVLSEHWQSYECEVIDLSHGVYEVTGTCLHAGSYELRIRLSTLSPSVADGANKETSRGSLACPVQKPSRPGPAGQAATWLGLASGFGFGFGLGLGLGLGLEGRRPSG